MDHERRELGGTVVDTGVCVMLWKSRGVLVRVSPGFNGSMRPVSRPRWPLKTWLTSRRLQDCHALFHGTDAHTANFHHGAFHFTKVIRLDAGMSTEATQPQFRNHRQQRKDGIMKRTSNHTRLSYNSLKIFNLTLVALCQKSWSKPQDQPSATAGLLLPLFRDVSPHSCRLWCDQLHHNRAEQGPTIHDISSPGSSRD